jgi:hypothetical protein
MPLLVNASILNLLDDIEAFRCPRWENILVSIYMAIRRTGNILVLLDTKYSRK